MDQWQQQQRAMENASRFGAGAVIVYLALVGFFVFVGWRLFEKAGKPGWAAVIPVYNIVVLLQIVGRPVWWVILMLIPIVNSVTGIVVLLDLARSFGKGTGFGVGLILLGFVFGPILALGGATYVGPAAGGGKPVMA